MGYRGDFLSFPKFKFHIEDKSDLIIYATDVGKTTNKIHWSSLDGLHLHGAKSTVSNHPRRLPSQKPNPSKSTHRCMSTIDLHRYFGFRTLKNIKHFQSVAQPTVTIIQAGDFPLQIGDVTTIKRHISNKSPVSRQDKFFDAAHMDIAYGDIVAPGGIKFALIVVNRKTRYTYVLPLRNCQSSTIFSALKQLRLMAGKLPTYFYTDFDPKLLSSTALSYCSDHNCMVFAAPTEQQHQNGLVERTWQTLSNMARAFVNDKTMRRSYCYWAIRHAARVHNIYPVHYNDTITTHHEMVYNSNLTTANSSVCSLQRFSPTPRTVPHYALMFNPTRYMV